MTFERDLGQPSRMASFDDTEAGYDVSKRVIEVDGLSTTRLNAGGLGRRWPLRRERRELDHQPAFLKSFSRQ